MPASCLLLAAALCGTWCDMPPLPPGGGGGSGEGEELKGGGGGRARLGEGTIWPDLTEPPPDLDVTSEGEDKQAYGRLSLALRISLIS